jgi:Mycolic acid cyclopropane synthetase
VTRRNTGIQRRTPSVSTQPGGALAIHAAATRGCRVTTTTIARAQVPPLARADHPRSGPRNRHADRASGGSDPHYVETLRRWRANFVDQAGDLDRLGYDGRFRRLWTLYLSYCEAGFAERRILNLQLLLAKPRCRVALPVAVEMASLSAWRGPGNAAETV